MRATSSPMPRRASPAGRSPSTARDRRSSRPRGAAWCSSSRSIAAVATVVFCLIAWLLLRGRREADRQSARSRQRDELSHALGAASFATEVSRGLAVGLAAAFPGALAVVALEARGSPRPRARRGRGPGARRGHAASSCRRPQTHAYEAGGRSRSSARPRSASSSPPHGPPWRRARRSTARHCVARGGAAAWGRSALPSPPSARSTRARSAHVGWFAEEAAQALDRARSYEHEHDVAVSLQRSLLSQELPQIEGVELLGRYQAGSAGMEVGGDWYDVVRRSDGIVHVTRRRRRRARAHGRGADGPDARTRSGPTPTTTPRPPSSLRRMRRHVGDDEMVTAVCLTLDPYTQELTYASAGHPPALLFTATPARRLAPRPRAARPARIRPAEMIREADVPPGRRLDDRGLHRRPHRAPRMVDRRRHRSARPRCSPRRCA